MKFTWCLIPILLMFSCSNDSDNVLEDDTVIITPGIGIGAISFNSTGSDVTTNFGDAEDITAIRQPSGTQFVIWYYDKGLGFRLDEIEVGSITLQEVHDMRFDLIDYSQKIYSMTILPPFKGETSDGIKLGSTKNEVVQAFGDPEGEIAGADSYNNGKFLISYNSSSVVNRIDMLK